MRVTTLFLSCSLLVMSLSLSGCLDLSKNSAGNEATATPAEPPKPMTEEEIYAEMKTVISPYRQVILGRGGLGDHQQRAIISALQEGLITHGGNPEGQKAFLRIGDDLIQYAREGKVAERWKLVQGCVDAHSLLNIESHLLNRLDTRAKENLSRPRVTVQGYMEDLSNDSLFVFLELLDRSTGILETVTVQEGEEFNNLRLVEVTPGRNEIVLEYLPIEGMSFTVEGVKRIRGGVSSL